MLNIYKGITIPAKAVEGAISIVDTVSVTGDGKKPSLAKPIAEGDPIKIVGDDGEKPLVAKADNNADVVIGFAHDHPEYSVDPTTNYTENQAKNAGMLRECGVETAFTDVRTVDAKASENIAAGDYVVWSADGYKKSQAATTTIALVGQTTDDKITVGIR